MARLQTSQNKTLFIEFIQFLTPKWVLPKGVCVVISIQVNAQSIRISPKLLVKLWGKKKVFFKVFELDI